MYKRAFLGRQYTPFCFFFPSLHKIYTKLIYPIMFREEEKKLNLVEFYFCLYNLKDDYIIYSTDFFFGSIRSSWSTCKASSSLTSFGLNSVSSQWLVHFHKHSYLMQSVKEPNSHGVSGGRRVQPLAREYMWNFLPLLALNNSN